MTISSLDMRAQNEAFARPDTAQSVAAFDESRMAAAGYPTAPEAPLEVEFFKPSDQDVRDTLEVVNDVLSGLTNDANGDATDAASRIKEGVLGVMRQSEATERQLMDIAKGELQAWTGYPEVDANKAAAAQDILDAWDVVE